MNVTKHRAIRVHFFAPVNGKTDYYFGSIKAIYEVFQASDIGLTMQSLYVKHITESRPAVTTRCHISRVEIVRCAKRLEKEVDQVLEDDAQPQLF